MFRPEPSSTNRSTFVLAAALLLAAASEHVCAQKLYAPVGGKPWLLDLSGRTNAPFSREHARQIDYYSAREVGTPTSTGVTKFTIRNFAWRYDGPSVSPLNKRLTLGRLVVRMGVTSRAFLSLTADNEANLSNRLTTVVDIQNFSYQTDTVSTGSKQPWGGPNKQFLFTLKKPLAVTIPPGGCFVVEALVTGGQKASTENFLDLAYSSTDWKEGSGAPGGLGCPANATAPPLGVAISGTWLPGGVVSVVPTGLSPNAPAVSFVSPRLGQPATIPGTRPACTLYIDLNGAFMTHAVVADARGQVPIRSPGTWIALPRDPVFCGLRSYGQWVAATPRWSGNQVGVQLSNYVAGLSGCLSSKPVLGAFGSFRCCDRWATTDRYGHEVGYCGEVQRGDSRQLTFDVTAWNGEAFSIRHWQHPLKGRALNLRFEHSRNRVRCSALLQFPRHATILEDPIKLVIAGAESLLELPLPAEVPPAVRLRPTVLVARADRSKLTSIALESRMILERGFAAKPKVRVARISREWKGLETFIREDGHHTWVGVRVPLSSRKSGSLRGVLEVSFEGSTETKQLHFYLVVV